MSAEGNLVSRPEPISKVHQIDSYNDAAAPQRYGPISRLPKSQTRDPSEFKIRETSPVSKSHTESDDN